MNISFEDRVALVTGAAMGLGLATARAFAEAGASVVLADTDEDALHIATRELADKGHRAIAVRCDVSDDAQVAAMVGETVAAGDVVWIPPGVKHWHGATTTESVTHLAIQEAVDGSVATWMEHVTDEQYDAAPPHAHTGAKVDDVSPALARYTEGAVLGDLWKRPGLSARDRSLVTLAVLITRNQSTELAPQLELALDHGVTPAEISELVTHLAFYAGWGNAMAVVPVVRQIFVAHGVTTDQLPSVTGTRLALDEVTETQRATRVQESFGAVAPGLVQYTTDLLFRDLWLRPALAPRDRSLVTVAALVASGQVGQVDYHLNRAMDNGLTRTEVSEMITHLAFYAGWPSVFSALPVVKAVLEKR